MDPLDSPMVIAAFSNCFALDDLGIGLDVAPVRLPGLRGRIDNAALQPFADDLDPAAFVLTGEQR